ncbi:MAG: hypothetical protein FWB93_03140 [Oscillospiraceae bacterium]|nr:hypothetical protein [Oscillospiraceae bacterium]
MNQYRITVSHSDKDGLFGAITQTPASRDGDNHAAHFAITQPAWLDKYACMMDFRNTSKTETILVEDGEVPLTAEMAVHGTLSIQLVYTLGNKSIKTNIMRVPIDPSINATDPSTPGNSNVIGRILGKIKCLFAKTKNHEDRIVELEQGGIGGGITQSDLAEAISAEATARHEEITQAVTTEANARQGEVDELRHGVEDAAAQATLATNKIWGTPDNPNGIVSGAHGKGRLNIAEEAIAAIEVAVSELDIDGAIAAHNEDSDAHGDIRSEVAVKLDRVDSGGTLRAYAVDSGGEQTMIEVSADTPASGTIPARNANGTIVVGEAVAGADAVNLQQVQKIVEDAALSGGDYTPEDPYTDYVKVSNPAVESLGGTATSQSVVNSENKNDHAALWEAENRLENKVNANQKTMDGRVTALEENASGGGGTPLYYGAPRTVFDNEIGHGAAFTNLCDLVDGAEYTATIDAVRGTSGSASNADNDVRFNLQFLGSPNLSVDFHAPTANSGTIGFRASFTHIMTDSGEGTWSISNRVTSLRRSITTQLNANIVQSTVTHNNPGPSEGSALTRRPVSNTRRLRFNYPVSATSRIVYRVRVTETIPIPLKEA